MSQTHISARAVSKHLTALAETLTTLSVRAKAAAQLSDGSLTGADAAHEAARELVGDLAGAMVKVNGAAMLAIECAETDRLTDVPRVEPAPTDASECRAIAERFAAARDADAPSDPAALARRIEQLRADTRWLAARGHDASDHAAALAQLRDLMRATDLFDALIGAAERTGTPRLGDGSRLARARYMNRLAASKGQD